MLRASAVCPSPSFFPIKALPPDPSIEPRQPKIIKAGKIKLIEAKAVSPT